MLTPSLRKKEIENLLYKTFSPTFLEVKDDSDKHRGHEGAKDGAGHFTVTITAESFKSKTRIAIHREIYESLAHLIPNEIHALSIKIGVIA